MNHTSLTVVVSLVLLVSALGKLRRQESIVAAMQAVGVPRSWLPRLASVEIAGASGLLAGLAYPPLGIAAGAGVFLYFCGAVVFHLRANDRKGLVAPSVLAVMALLATLLTVRNA
ncbi:DoxX family protein [Streptomyces sp. NPDC001027]|uniref:DoxX family protein n=1 Tax=Streptomyces sp. NPDC001027 TaxID=3154771 RepID=UPI00331DA89F